MSASKCCCSRYSVPVLNLVIMEYNFIQHFICQGRPSNRFGCRWGKVHPRRDHVGPEAENRYSCTLSWTSVLHGGGMLWFVLTLSFRIWFSLFFSLLDIPVGQGLLYEVSQSHSVTPHSVGILWPSDRLAAENSAWQYTTLRQTYMPSAGFKPAIPTREGLQTHALNRAATGIGRIWLLAELKFKLSFRSRTLFPILGSSHCNMHKKLTDSHRLLRVVRASSLFRNLSGWKCHFMLALITVF